MKNETIVKDSGLRMIKRKSGSGDTPNLTDLLIVHYDGYLPDGTVFDSSRNRNQAFQFPLGQGRVIKGWDEAFADMKVGDQWTLIIPPDLAYGDNPPGKLPKNQILVCESKLFYIWL